MTAFNWLKRLRKSERGNVLMMGAASMPLLVGSAAMAIDTVQLSLWKRELQRAADSSAIAGAYAVAQGQDASTAVTRDRLRNAYIDGGTPAVATGAFGGFNQTVQVTLASQRPLPFMSMFLTASPNLQAVARAAVVPTGEYCMISLYDGLATEGIKITGNANIDLGCGMVTNSRAASAIDAGGSSSINADPVAAVGGLNPSSNYATGTTLQPYSVKQRDPLAHLPDPPSCTSSNAGAVLSGGTTATPGCYAGINVKNNEVLSLQPGTYYFSGDLDIKGTVQHVTGTTGVALVMTGPVSGTSVNAGDLKMNSGGSLKLTAPETGNYAGVVLYRDRRADEAEQTINGHSSSAIQGAIYMPSSDLKMNGGSSMAAQCLQLIGRYLKITGGADIVNNCPANSASQAFRGTIVRLIV